MYVTDLRREFFEELKGPRRVLLLVHLDVDALCAAKILLELFRVSANRQRSKL